MVKIVALVKRKQGLTSAQFRHHYEKYHAPMAQRMVGHLMTRYVRNYPQELIEYEPEDAVVDDSYDAVTEFWFKDASGPGEMQRIFNMPDNNREILEDEERFQDRLKTRLLIVDVVDTGTTAGMKVEAP